MKLLPATRKRLADIGERVLWTLLEAGGGEAFIHTAHVPQQWLLPTTAVLALLKTSLTSALSKNGSAAALPADLDPVPAPPGRHEAPEETSQ